MKRSFKLDFDRHIDGQKFRGLKKLSLHAGVTDLTKSRESLAYACFRAAGVPAPRTAFAEVTLTVPGKYDKVYLGLYTIVEQVDKPFLKAHFKNGKGMLLKPEGLQGGLTHFGDDWRQYEQRYRPKDEPTKKQQQRLIAFTRLINRADDATFRKEIAAYLDVDAFLRFLAANAILANMDSFLGFGHNYYLYLRADNDKFVFVPWDLDLSLAAWPVAGTPEQQVELSVMHPYAGENKLIDRLLAMKDVKERYRRLLKEAAAGWFNKERLLKEVDAIDKVTKEPLAKEAKAKASRKEGNAGGPFGGGIFGQSLPPRAFFVKRTASLAAQLEGKSDGYVPRPGGMPGFGRPGGMPGFGRPGEVLNEGVQQALRLSPEQRKRLAEIQKEVDAKIEKLLTEEQREQWKRMRQTRPGGGPRLGPPGQP